MKIAYNPTGKPIVNEDQLSLLKNDIIFDLSGKVIYARGIPVGKVYLPFEKSTSSTTEGYNGLVPFPDYNGNSKTRFLREDGTWVVPNYRPISVNGTSILGNNNTALNLVAGTNITLSPKKDSNNKYTGEVTITASNPAWDNITGKPTTLAGYGITDAFKWYGAITSSNDDSLWGKLGAQSYGGVLPDGLTGQYSYGILTSFNNNKGTGSQFQLYASDYRGDNSINRRHIAWRTGFGANKGEWHRLANIDTENIFTESPTFEKQIKSTIATGTAPLSVVSTTLVTNLNAEMVGGLRAANFTRAINFNQEGVIPRNIHSVGYIVGTGVDGETPKGDGGGYLASVRHDGYGGHLFISNSGSVFSRGVKNSAVSSWQELAFTDSNVASATKLATPRTIWGQRFDGTNNVSGALYLGATSILGGDNLSILHHSASGYLEVGYGNATAGYSTYINGNSIHFRYSTELKTGILISSNGNVAIGAVSPTAKLHVDGNSIINGNIKATSFLGNLDGSYINKLTGYTKPTTSSDITANDTLNTALGKLELKADTAYELVKGAYDGDGTIENLAEILKVLEGISDTDTIKSLLGKYRRLDKDEFYDSEVRSNFWINRTIEGGGGWAYVPILVFKSDKETKLLNIGVYGNNSDLIYSYIGSNDHNSTKNLRIYPDGTVTAPVFNGNLNYTNLTGSTTTANQAIVSNGTKDGWTLKTLGSNAFNSNTYLQILSNVNANELKENGVGYITLNGPNGNGPIISFGGTNYHTQIYSDYLGNNLYWRVNKNNELQGWKQIVSIDILSDYLSNKSWNKVVPYVYESPTVYYYCYKIAQLNLSATLSGIAVIELLGIGDSNYANMASAKLKISRYYSASEKTTDGKTTHTISRKYTIGLLSDSYKGCYFVAYLDSDGGVWVKCHKCEWTSSLQWRLVSNGSSNTGLITNIYDSTTAEYIKTVPDNVKATAYPNQFAEWSKRTVKTKSEGETEWAETTDSEGITDGGFNTPFGSNLTTWYNDTVYDILRNNDNSNVVLNSCGGGLYLGYENTSSISLEKPTYAKYNITASKFVTSGGTASQFVKGDGSLDSNTYVSETKFPNLSSKGLYKILTSSGGGSNINKWKKFARINLSSDKVYTECGGYMFIYDHEGHRVKGILDFHVRTEPDTSINNSNINLQSPYLRWHILDNSNYASNIKMVKVENGIFDLYITTSQTYTTFVILVFTPRSDKITLFNETWIDTLPKTVIATSSYTITVPNATTATKLANTLTFSAGNFTSKTYNGSSAVTVNIPTHTSHLTNDSFAVHNPIVKNVPSLTRSTLGYAYGCGDTCGPNLDSFWYDAGPVAIFGVSSYLCAILASAGNNNIIKYKKVVNGSAQESWKTFVNSDGTQIGSSVRPVYVKNDGSVAPFTLSNATANDTRNILVGYDNGIYLVTSAKINPSTGILIANGFVKSGSTDSHVLLGAGGHKALSDFLLETEFASKELASNLTTITIKSLAVTTDWMDTGIIGSHKNESNTLVSGDLETGTYIVQVYCSGAKSGGISKFYNCYWSGVMSWYSGTNSTNSLGEDEILLHRSGHADNNCTIYLRTKLLSGTKGLKLLIAANQAMDGAEYTFKFKRII